ncbi:MAG: DUF2231 domain-containing protein [Candidatus Binatia bacterium]
MKRLTRTMIGWAPKGGLLILLFIGCWITSAFGQDEVPVPPLEEGALLIIHPIAVHFAIALTFFGCGADWFGHRSGQLTWQITGQRSFLAGVAALGAAVLTGWIEHELPRPSSAFDSQINNLLFYHEYGGYVLLGMFIVLAVIRVRVAPPLPLAFLVLTTVGLVGILVQGYTGGEMVYRYGAGVRAVQVLSQQQSKAEQKKASEESSEAQKRKE